MDIKNNKYFSLPNIKRATASAILTLNAEAVMAVPCPSFITDSALAGVVCDFTSTSSVTVENGGVVGGISMIGYSPPSSQIVIEAGGLVNNNFTNGISISSSSLTNGITNHGIIDVLGDGINIDAASTISGGIVNTGSITTSDVEGIRIVNSNTISGGISNSGSIISNSTNDAPLVIGFNNIINGDITNDGLIQANGIGPGMVIFFSNTILGNISNSGSIVAGSTGLLFINNNVLSGNILNSGSIFSASLDAIDIGNASTVGGNIINSGVLEAGAIGLAIFSQSTVSGGIVNTGNIIGSNVGILVGSSASISNGISNAGTIQGNIQAIVVDSSSTVSHIDIVGQSARVIGAVSAVNTDVNITSGAVFTSEGSYNVNSFLIGSNALFHMANAIEVQNAVINAGTLSVGTTTQTITGNYVQNAGGVFQTGITNNLNYGQLLIDSTLDLSQSGSIDVQINPNNSIHEGDVFTSVISGNTLIMPTNGFNVSDNSFFWNFIATLNNNNTGVDLTARVNPTIYNICQGDYCQGAASTIIGQIAAGNPLFSAYTLLSSASAFKEAASQATAELTNENLQMVQLMSRAVQDVVPMWSHLRGQSAGDAFIAQPGKLWMKPYAASMKQNERNTVNGFHATAYGAVIGKDVLLTNDWLFGGALAAGGDRMQGKTTLNGQSIESTAYQGMVYAAKRLPNQIYVAGQGLLGYENNQSKRVIPLYASTAQGSFNSWFTNLRGELGWNIYALNQDFILTPEIEASYLYVTQGGYREFGSPMSLHVASNNNSSLVLGAYFNGAYHLASMNNQSDLVLTGYSGIAGDVIHTQPEVISTFLAGGPSFSTFGVQLNEVVFRGGAGIAISNEQSPLKLNLNYDIQIGNNAYSGIGAATIKYKME